MAGLLIIFTLLFLFNSSSAQIAPISNGNIGETSEDCKTDQFYYLPQSRCRNCSDVTYLFQSYQEWLGQEVSGFHKATLNGPISGGKEKSSKNKFSKNDENSRSTDNDMILSRLINVDPQEQEYIDSSQDSGDSGSIESTDLTSDIIRTTKQTQRFVSRFIRSHFIGNELLGAIDQCRQYQNASACQMWSNMCVMTMYSYSDVPASSSSSSSLSPAHYDSKANYEDSSHSKRTWQNCRQYTITSICNSLRDWYRVEKKPNIDMLNIFAVDEPLVKAGSGLTLRLNQPIQLLAYKYSYNGKLIGIEQFGLSDMERFCLVSNGLNINQIDSNHIRLGKNMHLDCQFDYLRASLSANKNFNETVFIDLYIAYSLNGVTFVKSIPVLIKNLMYNSIQINRKYAKDPSRWKLVHRFFFQTAINLSDGEEQSETYENTVLYAKNAILDLKMKKNDKGALLTSILLTLDYDQLTLKYPILENSTSNSKMKIESSVSITQSLLDMESSKKDLDLILTILSILSSIWSLIKCYNIQKCYGLVKLDLDFLFRFIVICCDTLANLFTLITLLYLGYIFVLLKSQTTIQILAPNEDLEKTVIVNLQIAFAFKLIGFAHKLYVQLNADIFFVDWEKPKMLTSSQIIDHANYYNAAKEQNKHSSNTSGLQMSASSQQASFWRSYTVINRWLQLQAFCHHDITLQILSFVCIVDCLQLVNLATADVNLELVQSRESNLNQHTQLAPYTSVSLRLLILSVVYLSIYQIQISYKKYLHEPIIRNKIREFVDLCSVANVSVLIMLYPRFGYYIHGRNANGSGDCSIAEMNALLEREERDLCSKRGLAPNSDLQTFVLVLPKVINDHYRKLLCSDNLIASSHQTKPSNLNQFSQNKSTTGGSLLRSALNFTFASTSSFSSNRSVIDTIVIKNRAINLFFTNFLDHVYKDIDYLIRERRRFETILLDVDFDDENLSARNGPLPTGIDKSTTATFCKDHGDSFTALLLLSFEGDLILVDLLSLLILDLWLGQPLVIIPCILVWLFHQAFTAIYASCARQNLITKALVDEKFLLR